jgi:SecY interacting protein Syd
MTSSNYTKLNLADILQQFSTQYVKKHQEVNSHLPRVEQDEQWPSPCEITFGDATENKPLLEGEVHWQPVNIEIEEFFDFDNVENALEITLHQDIKTYFTTIFSESLDATSEDGGLTLLFAWNKDDFQRLQENIIGHILMKQRLKQTETVFFAVTDEEDMIISLDNNTGEVWVEQVGCKPHKKLADSLGQFIMTLTPQVTNVN